MLFEAPKRVTSKTARHIKPESIVFTDEYRSYAVLAPGLQASPGKLQLWDLR